MSEPLVTHEATCVQCGKLFTWETKGKRWRPRKTCGYECFRRQETETRKRSRRRQGILARQKEFKPRAIVTYQCANCGKDISRPERRGTKQSFCNHACYIESLRVHPTVQARWHYGHAVRRARMKEAMVETFDPLDVFERDGWRCHLCGGKTNPRLRGTVKPKAPVLDHIIPLAKGGEHSRVNTACACYRCNATKQAKVIGQPSLLAFAH